MPAGLALFEGSPLEPLWNRLESMTGIPAVRLRLLSSPAVAWIPLLVLGAWVVPFFSDFEAQARLLVALPLLLWARHHADRVLLPMLDGFVTRRVVREGDVPRFREALASTCRISRSPLTLVVLLGLAWGAGHWLWERTIVQRTGTWYEGTSRVGHWYAWISIPLFHYVLYGWYVRLLLWTSLLWRIARLDLRLVVTHPDRAGGIGFLGNSVYAFLPFVFAQGVMVSGGLSNAIFHRGERLQDFRVGLVVLVGVALLAVLGPFTVFSGPLIRAKRAGRTAYAKLASRYTLAFTQKWMGETEPEPQTLLGTEDLQSLADLAQASDIVQSMRPVPFSRKAVLKVVVAFLLPIAPLVFTMFSLAKVVDMLLKTIL